MKTAVSIPDEIFGAAEKLAADLELTRSALYARALRELIQRQQDDAVTAQLNAAFALVPDEVDPFIQRAAYLAAKRAGGNW